MYLLWYVKKFVDPKSRTQDQMVQAARSGKQNIAEGSQTSGTSKKSELRLLDVARASLQELLEDYQDFLRINHLQQWEKTDARVATIRQLAYKADKSYRTYLTYMSDRELAANCLITLISQANYLLNQQLRVLARELGERGDLQERVKQQKKERLVGNIDVNKFLSDQGFRKLEDGRMVRSGE